MAQYLPNLMANLFNTPICLSPAKAGVLCAALSGRLNIASLETETRKLDARGLADLLDMGRRGEIRGAPMPGISMNAPGSWVEAANNITAPGSTEGQYWNGERPYQLTASGVAIIKVHGTLTRTWGVGPESGATGYDGIWTQLLFAQDDRAVKGIMIDINSGGGAVDGLFDLTDGISALSARNGGKPIFALAADYAYSAAYAIGAAADKFFVPRTGGVGSIGCIMLHADISQALEEEGIKVHVIRSHARKARGIGGEALDDQDLKHLQDQIDEVGAVFVEKVAAYMPGLKKSDISQLEGLDYIGSRAKAIGLVTDVASEPEAWMKLERRIARN